MAWNAPFELNPSEYPPYYELYLQNVAGLDISAALDRDGSELLRIFSNLTEGQGAYAYAPGKWTVKEVLLHCIDAERIFSYRALRFMRGDNTDLPGYDHEAYVSESLAPSRSVTSLREEWRDVRSATMALFGNAQPADLLKSGTANGFSVSARALGLIIPGHYLHHIRTLKERYGLHQKG